MSAFSKHLTMTLLRDDMDRRRSPFNIYKEKCFLQKIAVSNSDTGGRTFTFQTKKLHS